MAFRIISKPTSQPEQQAALPQSPQGSLRLVQKHVGPDRQEEPGFFSKVGQNVKEAAQQTPKELIAGALGGWGDILDLIGLNEPQGSSRQVEFSKKEHAASPTELALMQDEEILPRFSRLPTSSEASSAIGKATGIEEPTTAGGRYAKRGSRAIGSAATTPGGPMVKATAAASTVGQTLEEMGAPGWVQAVAEIGTFLKTGNAKRNVTSNSPEVKKELERLQRMGFSQEDITLAKNALEDRGILKKISKHTSAVDDKFKSSLKSVEDLTEKTINSAFPGMEKGGVEGLAQASSGLFDSLEDAASKLTIRNPKKFEEKTGEAIARIKKTLANTPKEKEVITLLKKARDSAMPENPSKTIATLEKAFEGDPNKDAITKSFRAFATNLYKADKASDANSPRLLNDLMKNLSQSPKGKEGSSIIKNYISKSKERKSADYFTRFYRGLNQLGKWTDPKERERVYSTVKDAIKDTFKDQGPEGVKVAGMLEDANKSWMKYLNAKDVSEFMGKVATEEGINYHRLNRLMENPSNYKMLQKSLGKEQSGKLKQIAKTGSDMGSLQKAMKGTDAKKNFETAKLLGLGTAIVTGNVKGLATYFGSAVLGRLASKLLTDPEWQNIQLKMMEAVRDKKWGLARNLAQRAEKKLDTED